jgi:hypothetical protein
MIPTALLGVVVLYWIVVIIGVLDLDFLDFDLEGVDSEGPFYSIAMFLHIEEIPFGLVMSLIVLNFWIITMLMYFLPIDAGGLLNGLLLLPALAGGVVATKYETIPLRGLFKNSYSQGNNRNQVVFHLCTLLCDIKSGKLGQAAIERNGASIVINVKSDVEGESFAKNEVAVVLKKDTDRDFYYIIKTKGN